MGGGLKEKNDRPFPILGIFRRKKKSVTLTGICCTMNTRNDGTRLTFLLILTMQQKPTKNKRK
jgi:hypothetical protein